VSHPRTTAVLALGLAAVGAVGLSLPPLARSGAWLGFLLGAALCGFGVVWQSHWLRVAPRRALAAQLESFLVKLAAVTLGALAFRYVGALAEVADWRAFTVAFAAAVALLLPVSTFETARRFRARADVTPRTAP
jgi:Na+/proline symporter